MSDEPDVEAILVSERLGHVERRLEALEKLAVASGAHLARLVELAEADDARKEAALALEIQRRTASQEAEAKRVDAEIAEKAERGRWWRSTGLPQLIGVVVTVGGAVGTAITAWATGLLGSDK